ncbi:MAG TPA: (Fe-S)-binding protein, partial [Abditibacteriaceae bacterium]
MWQNWIAPYEAGAITLHSPHEGTPDACFSVILLLILRLFPSMKVTLFVPCFVDTFYPQTAISIVEILERLGHEVDYPQNLTCCGQPAFNSGFWDETRAVAGKVLDMLRDAEIVVIASGSCGAMLKVFYPEIWK